MTNLPFNLQPSTFNLRGGPLTPVQSWLIVLALLLLVALTVYGLWLAAGIFDRNSRS